MKAETTETSVESLRDLAGIKNVVLPSGFSKDKIYDKWGNENPGEEIIPGPLFYDKGCQTMLKLKARSKFS